MMMELYTYIYISLAVCPFVKLSFYELTKNIMNHEECEEPVTIRAQKQPRRDFI